jgi:hypothetical protein
LIDLPLFAVLAMRMRAFGDGLEHAFPLAFGYFLLETGHTQPAFPANLAMVGL